MNERLKFGLKILGEAAKVAGVEFYKRSGLRESAAARLRRQNDSRTVEPPAPGTPLLVQLAGFTEHTGIYLGENRVAELHGSGRLINVSLSEFLNGQPNDSANMRWGMYIYAACDEETGKAISASRSVESANSFISNVEKVDYNLFCNNCHLFTASCIRGVMADCISLDEWWKNGTFSIRSLERVVSEEINGGRPVCWLRILGPSDSFAYELTEEKKIRLENMMRELEGNEDTARTEIDCGRA